MVYRKSMKYEKIYRRPKHCVRSKFAPHVGRGTEYIYSVSKIE